MRSDRQAKDQQFEEGLAKLIGCLIAAALALLYPQSFGAMVGAAAGAAHPWRFDDHGDRRYWRALAGWAIATGLVVAAAYALLATTVGADVELRRFHRQWGWGHFSAAAWIDHPWAWLPTRLGRGTGGRGRRDPLEGAMTGVLGFATAIGFVGVVVAAVAATRGLLAEATGRTGRRRRDRDGGVLIATAGRRGALVSLGTDELQQGVLIGGSPGAGKTTLLTAIGQRLPVGVGCLFVDLKGDRSLPDRLAIPPERVFGLGDRVSAAFNPLDRGNPASWRDILMATQEWSEPHYRQAAARFVGSCLASLDQVNDKVELDQVIALLEQPKSAIGLVRQLDEPHRSTLARSVSLLESESSLRSGVLGLGNRLALLRDSPATARRFGSSGGIDLEAILRGERALFSLPAAEFPEEAPAIAAAVIQSFGAAGQRLARGDEPLRALLIVDEAARLGGNQLRESVAIGRGAGIGTAIAVQDFADLDYVAAGTREAVETGANTWIVMRQVASAEQIANAFGSQTTKRTTVQRDVHRWGFSDTGMRSEREVEEYRVSPNVIRGLGRGEAVVWRRLRGGTVERVTIVAGER